MQSETIGNTILYHADYQEILPDLPEHSVRALLTDPPYGATDNAWDVRPDMTAFWKHALRVTMPKACIAFTCAGAPVAQFIMSNPDMYRYDIVWQKTKAVGFFDIHRRPLHAHELILVFCTARDPEVYNPQKWLKPGATGYFSHSKKPGTDNYGRFLPRISYCSDGMRFPIDVITAGLQFNAAHRSCRMAICTVRIHNIVLPESTSVIQRRSRRVCISGWSGHTRIRMS